jgi:uncharacterized repeat protein (TIGR01451 family)
VLVHQVTPDEVRLGKPYNAEFHVTNLSGRLEEVLLFLDSASNMRIQSSTPMGIQQGSKMAWAVGPLEACETAVVKVTAVSDQMGTASNCLSVSYSNVLCSGTNVVNPSLRLVKTGPAEVTLCDPFAYTFTVTNDGSGLAENVMIMDPLPNGLTAGGKSEISIDVGNLPAGESRTFTVNVDSAQTGRFTNSATASGFPDLTASSGTVTTVITQPVLAISTNCEDFEYIGRKIDTEFTVRNNGDAVADNVTLMATLPAGVTFSAASDGGSPSAGMVNWNLGDIAVGGSRTVKLTTVPGPTVNSVTINATAKHACAADATIACTTEVRGIPAILLEVVDVLDPVEVGDQSTYVITVTNQGSAQDNDIRVVVILPPEMQYVSDSGPTDGVVSGQRISFNPLPSLAPQAQAEYRVVFKALRSGDIRGRFEMTSKQFPTPVTETESTNLYD